MSEEYKIPISLSGHQQAAKGLEDVANSSKSAGRALTDLLLHQNSVNNGFNQLPKNLNPAEEGFRKVTREITSTVHAGHSLASLMEGNLTRGIMGLGRSLPHIWGLIKAHPFGTLVAGIAAAGYAITEWFDRISKESKEMAANVRESFAAIHDYYQKVESAKISRATSVSIGQDTAKQDLTGMGAAQAGVRALGDDLEKNRKEFVEKKRYNDALERSQKMLPSWLQSRGVLEEIAKGKEYLDVLEQQRKDIQEALDKAQDEVIKRSDAYHAKSGEEFEASRKMAQTILSGAGATLSPLNKAQMDVVGAAQNLDMLRARQHELNTNPALQNDPNLTKQKADIAQQIADAQNVLAEKRMAASSESYHQNQQESDNAISSDQRDLQNKLAKMNPNAPSYGVQSAKLALKYATKEREERGRGVEASEDYEGADKAQIVADAEAKLEEATNKELEAQRKVTQELNSQAEKIDQILQKQREQKRLEEERDTAEFNAKIKINGILDARYKTENESGFNYGDSNAGRLTAKTRMSNRRGLQRDEIDNIRLGIQERVRKGELEQSDLDKFDADYAVIKKHTTSNGLFGFGSAESKRAKADMLRLAEDGKLHDVWHDMGESLKNIESQLVAVKVALDGAK